MSLFEPPVAQLALGWYSSTPLPNHEPEAEPLGTVEPTALSRRLLGVFDDGLFCDTFYEISGSEPVGAHRIVVGRNPDLDLGEATSRVVTVVGMAPDTLRAVLRSHYIDITMTGVFANMGPRSSLETLRSTLTDEERVAVEAVFGPLDASRWAELSKTVRSGRFFDCKLLVDGGADVPSHRAILAGAQDGHYFSAAWRWPGAGQAVRIPEGLSRDALMDLLELRYGSEKVDSERILEVRHYAELFDWPEAREFCEAELESLLSDPSSVEAASLLAVYTHTEEQNVSVPAHLKAAALAGVVRQWSKVTELAEEALGQSRYIELQALSRIRNRDGVVFGNLEEYLHACSDDLTEWERSLSQDANNAVRKQLERGWAYWHQVLFAHGRIAGADVAERWRERVRAMRERLREERAHEHAKRLRLADGRLWFEPTFEWREVPSNAVCPGGLEYRLDMETGRNFARLCA